MGIARNIARLIPNGSGLLPNANIEAVAASKLTGQVPDANAPSGSIIQVVHGQLISNRVQVSSSSFVTVGNGVSITPLSTSSKILIRAQIGINIRQEISIGRGGNTNITGVSHGLVTETDDNWTTQSLFYVDSPNSTSSQTYYVTVRGYNGSTSTVYISDFSPDGPFAYMILMEIAA